MTDGESLEARCFSVSLGVLLWSLCTLYSFLAALFNPQGFSLGLRRMVTACIIDHVRRQPRDLGSSS